MTHTRSITIKKGDTLSGIALRECGEASLWPKLAALNGISAPYTIFVGSKINVPDRPLLKSNERGVRGRAAVTPSSNHGDSKGQLQFGAVGLSGAGRKQGPMCAERNASQYVSPLDECPVAGATDAGAQQAMEILNGVFVAELERAPGSLVGLGFEWEDKERHDVVLLEFESPLLKGKMGFKGTIKVSRPGVLGTLWANEEGQLKYETEVADESKKAIISIISGSEVSVTPKDNSFEFWANLGFKIGNRKLVEKTGFDKEGAVLRFESTTVQEAKLVGKVMVEVEGTYYLELRRAAPDSPEPAPVPVKAPNSVRVNTKPGQDEVQGILDRVKGLDWNQTLKGLDYITAVTGAVAATALLTYGKITAFGTAAAKAVGPVVEAAGTLAGDLTMDLMMPFVIVTPEMQKYLQPMAGQYDGGT
jgi:LysM repeat protein